MHPEASYEIPYSPIFKVFLLDFNKNLHFLSETGYTNVSRNIEKYVYLESQSIPIILFIA